MKIIITEEQFNRFIKEEEEDNIFQFNDDSRMGKMINQSIKYGKDSMYIVFDDYGLPESIPAVKVAVDELINNNILEFVKYIGEPLGNEPRIGKPLVDWEGIITKVIIK